MSLFISIFYSLIKCQTHIFKSHKNILHMRIFIYWSNFVYSFSMQTYMFMSARTKLPDWWHYTHMFIGIQNYKMRDTMNIYIYWSNFKIPNYQPYELRWKTWQVGLKDIFDAACSNFFEADSFCFTLESVKNCFHQDGDRILAFTMKQNVYKSG